MCVAQFRDYCNAFAFKTNKSITNDDVIDKNRGTFNGSGNSFSYTKSKAKMNSLAKSGNEYANNEPEGFAS